MIGFRSKLNSGSTELLKKQAPENLAEAFKILGEAFSAMQTDMRIRSEPLWAMQKSLMQKLEAGKLEACGVQSAPKQKRQLEVIPEHFFVDAKINWDGNKVTNFGVTYSAVRVRRRSSVTSRVSTEKALNASADVPSKTLTEPAERGTSEANASPVDAPSSVHTKPAEQETREAQRRKPGPPSAAEEVISAYNQLLQKGVLKENMTVVEKYEKLFPVLKKIFPNERGLAYSSIARHLRSRPAGRSKFSS